MEQIIRDYVFTDSHADTKRRRAHEVLQNAFNYHKDIRFADDEDFFTILLDLAEAAVETPTESHRRIHTEIPLFWIARACGYKTGHLALVDQKGKTWREFLEDSYPKRIQRRREDGDPEKNLPKMEHFLSVLKRYFAGRKELLDRRVRCKPYGVSLLVVHSTIY